LTRRSSTSERSDQNSSAEPTPAALWAAEWSQRLRSHTARRKPGAGTGSQLRSEPTATGRSAVTWWKISRPAARVRSTPMPSVVGSPMPALHQPTSVGPMPSSPHQRAGQLSPGPRVVGRGTSTDSGDRGISGATSAWMIGAVLASHPRPRRPQKARHRSARPIVRGWLVPSNSAGGAIAGRPWRLCSRWC
jgi:hypothetical protein